MKKSTDMFAAGESRKPDMQALLVCDDQTITGEKFSPFVISLRKNKKSSIAVQKISFQKHNCIQAEKKIEDTVEKITKPTQEKNLAYEQLFAAASTDEYQTKKIPSREEQINAARESMKRIEKKVSALGTVNRSGGFFRNLKHTT